MISNAWKEREWVKPEITERLNPNRTILNLYMKDTSKVENKVEYKVENNLTQNQKKILKLLKNNPYITLQELSKEANISETSINNNLEKLKKKNIIERIGAKRNGYWKIN